MATEHAHLKVKGKNLQEAFNQWNLGHTSGFHKANNTLEPGVHSAAFNVVVQTSLTSKEKYEPFQQHYTYNDHRNEVFRIEARHRHNLSSVYPSEHIINGYPCLPDNLTISDVEKALGSMVSLYAHDILQKSYAGYQPFSLLGVNFLIKHVQQHIKVALDIEQWNLEAQLQVDWNVELPVFK